MVVLAINEDSQFHSQLAYNGDKLVVVAFIKPWCGKCLLVYPVFEKLSDAFPKAVFLKVDVDVCRNLAKAQDLPILPTFSFYKHRVLIDRIYGGDDNQELEETIRQYYGAEAASADGLPPEGHMDLLPFITESEVLNALPEQQLLDILAAGTSFIESLGDRQLIFSVYFSQAVKVHSFRLKAPTTNGPKMIKVFINQPKALGFDEVENNIPAQTVEIDSMTLGSGCTVMLQFVKFQSVQNFHLFIEDNHDDSEVTRVNRLQIFGSPISAVNVNNLRRE